MVGTPGDPTDLRLEPGDLAFAQKGGLAMFDELLGDGRVHGDDSCRCGGPVRA